MSTLSVGVDLAQARDATALVAVESYRAEDDDGRKAKHHRVTFVHKLRRGLSYPSQAEAIAEIGASMDATPTLWLDATGVGRAVVDLVRQATPLTVKAVTLTSAHEVQRHGRDLSVPKAELVSRLEVALSTRRLHAAPGLALAGDLERELRAFSYELSATGRPLYEGRGEHDDLVIALALAVFGGEQGGSASDFLAAVREAGTPEARAAARERRLARRARR